MSYSPPLYIAAISGRGRLSIMGTVFVGSLTVFSFVVAFQEPVLALFGQLFGFFALSGIYSILKDEKWSIVLEDGVFTWSYPRWPKSSGHFHLRDVRHLEVSESSGKLTATFQDGTTLKVRFVGSGARLYDYVRRYYPDLSVEFIEGS